MTFIDNDHDWHRFLKTTLLADEENALLPLSRMQELSYEWRPESEEEFRTFLLAAPPHILEGFGFICYDTLPEIYHKHKEKVALHTGTDKHLYLFPEEWYDIIPAGYPLIDISGVKLIFERGVTDNSVRAGCLSYGVAISIVDKKG
ncbi:hypothetical protein [Chitinophaga tropicalis]|uniref:Uncharacterized protein n=1 Tax=Chitinophaga tropicalis TaxID=2683588 RepID=A0A7K1TZW2_9BACT|nr:hypothetical protein [Chitinophaga tropicalis]MVT07659.1 hypothetical protein [Chitinophaga tropicalis]